jgi:DNA-binding beta-propeller fold protein YncE
MEHTMNSLPSLLRSLVRSDSPKSSRRPRRLREARRRRVPRRLCLEALEDRTVPTTVSVANVSLNEISNVSTLVAPGSGGLSSPRHLALGPDGNVYVESEGTNSVIRYSPSGQLLGTFVAAGSGGLSTPFGLAFGPDGNLYVDSNKNSAILEYSGSTGAFLRTFVAAGSGGFADPTAIVFGPDGNLYVSTSSTYSVDRFEGPTGPNPGSPLPAAGQSGAYFVAPQSGGLAGSRYLLFGPDGNLYVGNTNAVGPGNTVPSTTNLGVLEYNGSTGAFIKVFTNTPPGDGGFAFDQEGRFYVADNEPEGILRLDSQGNYIDTPVTSGAASASAFQPFGMVFNSQGALLVSNFGIGLVGSVVQYNSGVTVTLSAASTSPVTVQYTTSDGTAIAGTDYTAQTGTVTFAPGQTSRLIPLVTLWNATPPANDYFTVQLSNPSGATIANGSAVVTIVPPTLPQLTINNTSAIEGDQTAHYRGAAVWGTTTTDFNPVTIGPDGNLYTTSGAVGLAQNTILRYNGTTGAFMGIFATGPMNGPRTILFRNGYMYVACENTDQVLQFDATTGAYLGAFVPAGSGGISGPHGMTFGPDGNLYVSGRSSNNVIEYNGTTGALIRTFVAAGSGGLNLPQGIAFDPSGQYLYVASTGGPDEVLKYNAQTGAYVGPATSGLNWPTNVKFGTDGLMYVLDTGANRIERFTESGSYVDDYVPVGSADLSVWTWMNFGPNGDLYVSSRSSNQIYEFGTENEAFFTVSLSAPFAEPVTVNYATADGTALAGTNYTATSGTITFPPGVTTQTIRVPLLDSGSQTTSLSFTVTLSNPQLATLSQSQGTGTIAPSDAAAKFYVVNDATSSLGGTNTAYKYQPSGTQQAPFGLSLNDLDPRGVAANAAGTTEWVVDANKNVYVYSTGGTLLGSWAAGGLSSSAQLTGIATNGTDIWLVDSSADKVYKYAGAASLRSGSQTAASSFSLSVHGHSGNGNPQDLVTDGTSFWVVDGTAHMVFKYTLTGSLLGSWAIDPANTQPTGITINPNNVSDIWIVDNGTDKVYQYVGAASRTSGSQNAAATFALAPGDTNPQGIADPPPADMLLTPTPESALPDAPSVAPGNITSSTGADAMAGITSLARRDGVLALVLGESLPQPGAPSVDLTAPLDRPPPAADQALTPVGAFGEPQVPPRSSHAFRPAHSAVDLLDVLGNGETDAASALATDACFALLAADAPAGQ